MSENEWLAERFEGHRAHLQGVAYRILGSLPEADDAVQQAWLRLSRADTSAVENLGGWLTTVVARVCLDMLRSRESRREEPIDNYQPVAPTDPEQETLLANSVGLALLVVLETLAPAERLAASRARRRVQGGTVTDPDVARQREVVDAFLAASRRGDFDALLAVLDPEATMRGAGLDFRGAGAIAERMVKVGARAAQPALIDGNIGVIVAPRGKLLMVLRFTIVDGTIVAIDAVKDARELDLKVL